MVNTYAAQSGGCRFESLWGFGFSLKGAYYEVGYCGKKTFLAGLQCTLTSSCAIKSVPLLHFSAVCDLPETSKKKFKKNRKFFLSIFSFLRAFVVSSCRKSGFRVFLSLRYGADLGRSRLVCHFCTIVSGQQKQKIGSSRMILGII